MKSSESIAYIHPGGHVVILVSDSVDFTRLLPHANLEQSRIMHFTTPFKKVVLVQLMLVLHSSGSCLENRSSRAVFFVNTNNALWVI